MKGLDSKNFQLPYSKDLRATTQLCPHSTNTAKDNTQRKTFLFICNKALFTKADGGPDWVHTLFIPDLSQDPKGKRFCCIVQNMPLAKPIP